MLKYFTKTPELLLPKHIVHFSKGFPDKFANKYFRVEYTQQIPYTGLSYNIEAGATQDVDLSDEDVGLVPRSDFTLYEILVALKGRRVLMYPMLPSTDYYYRLEEPNLRPTPSPDSSADLYKRYLGEYDESYFPRGEHRLRIHTVKDIDSIVLRLYADGMDTKGILKFIVNRCKIVEISRVEAERIGISREIQHYSLFKW